MSPLRRDRCRGRAVLRQVRLHAPPGRLDSPHVSADPAVSLPDRSGSRRGSAAPHRGPEFAVGAGASARVDRGDDRPHGAPARGEVLHPLPHHHLESRRILPRMPTTSDAVRRGGRRGRRTATMVRVARERISALFALAEREAATGHAELSDRYVDLARRVGTRYNVRVLSEYRELYCRGCSTFWIEGRTVRTRLRSGRRIRTCLRCGRERRTLLREAQSRWEIMSESAPPGTLRPEAEWIVASSDDELGDPSGDESEEE
jgi:ribonuclease P protein subunit RPR2